MKINDIIEGKSPHKKGTKKYKKHMAAMHAGMYEDATAGATSVGNIATVVNPNIARSKKKPMMQKPTDNALDMKNVSVFGGNVVKR